MAFLEILRENIHLGLPCVVWVRPMRGISQGCRIPYPEMFEQLQKALKRWNAR